MEYVIVEKSALARLADVHVARGAGGGVFDHFLVVAKVKERKVEVQCREVIQVSKLSTGEKEQE